MEKLFTVYKTTNNITGKIYIGVHKTHNPYDDYLGSGVILRNSIKKHGRESFHKEILLITKDRSTAYAMEKDLVTKIFVESSDTYNQKVGGDGGWDYVHNAGLTNKNKTADHYAKMGKRGNKVLHEKRKDKEFNQAWLAKVLHTQSQETRNKISNTLTGRKRNRCWINDGHKNVYHDTTYEIPSGFVKGKKKI